MYRKVYGGTNTLQYMFKICFLICQECNHKMLHSAEHSFQHFSAVTVDGCYDVCFHFVNGADGFGLVDSHLEKTSQKKNIKGLNYVIQVVIIPDKSGCYEKRTPIIHMLLWQCALLMYVYICMRMRMRHARLRRTRMNAKKWFVLHSPT